MVGVTKTVFLSVIQTATNWKFPAVDTKKMDMPQRSTVYLPKISTGSAIPTASEEEKCCADVFGNAVKIPMIFTGEEDEVLVL